jgi:prepilin-type N-terminal cleavage/methylation domain-containing protein
MRSRRAAFTLMEIMIALGLLAVVVGVTTTVVLQVNRHYASGVALSDLETRGQWGLSLIAEEMGDAGLTTLIPATLVSGDSLSFSRNTGYAGGILWSTPITFEQVGSQILRRQDGVDQLIATDVPVGGLAFTLNGRQLTISVTREMVIEQVPVQKTVATTITLMN